MRVENIKLFYKEVESNEVLQEKLKDLQMASEKERMTQLIHIAKEAGFEFSADELKAYIEEVITKGQENGELDDDELDQVSGGGSSKWVVLSVMTAGLWCLVSVARRKDSSQGCSMDKN